MRSHLDQMLRDAARQTARDSLSTAAATLRIGVMCTIGPLRFTPFLTAFRLEHPRIEMTIVDGVPANLADLLQQQSIEAAIMAQPSPFDERWSVQSLYRERFTIAMPPGHRLSALNAVPLRELHRENYVDRVDCEYGTFIGDLMKAAGVHIKIVYKSDREEWVQMMIMSGAGIACLPEYSPLLPGLRTRPMVEPDIVRDVSLVTPGGRRHSPAAAAFVEAARAYDWSL